MSPQSRLVAGIVLIIVPTVEIGGASILTLLIADPTYAHNDLRQDLWRAGHAHAGVWLVLSLVTLYATWTRRPSLRGCEVGGESRLPGCGGLDGVGLLPVSPLP
jgi:hypothetical protein